MDGKSNRQNMYYFAQKRKAEDKVFAAIFAA